MASFTQNRVIQYKDYVPTEPLDAMTQVGVQREQALQQGIQKVDSYFSSIAGLDVARSLDKDYIQQRLGDLKKGITSNLSGDFSDSRITNQIGGAASQIYKDPQVQNAVISTGAVRKGYSTLEDAKKAGKSNPNNEAYFNNKVNQYIQNQDPNASFNDSYIPYTDITAKMMDIAKQVGVDVKYVDHILNKGGDPMAIMTTEEFETNMPKIKAAAELLFQDGNVKQQLQVDGWAKYRGVDVADIYNPFVDRFNKQGEQLVADKMNLMTLISANIPASDKARYEEELKQISQREVNLKSDFSQLKELVTTNPEKFKEFLNETDYKNNLINIFSKEKYTTKYGDSPLTKVIQWQEKMKFDVQKEKNDNYYKTKNYDLSLTKEAREQAQFEADYPIDFSTGRRMKVTKEGKIPTNPNKKTTSADNPTDQAEYIARAEQSLNNSKIKLSGDALDIYKDYLSLTTGKEFSSETAKQNADLLAKGTGETTEAYLKRFASQTSQKLEDGGWKAPEQLQSKLNTYNKNFEFLNTQLLAYNKAEEDAKKEGGPTYTKAIASVPNSISIEVFDGVFSKNGILSSRNVDVNKADILALSDATSGTAINATPEERNLAKVAENKIYEKYGQEEGEKLIKAAKFSPINTPIYDALVNIKNNSSIKDAITKKYKNLAPIIGVEDNKNYTPANKEDQAESKTRLIGLIAGNTTLSGPDYDATKISAAANEANSTISFKLVPPTSNSEQWNGTAFIIDDKGKKYGVNLGQQDLEALALTKLSPYTLTAAELRVNQSKYKSTSLETPSYSKDAAANAYYKTTDFSKELQNSSYIVKGNIDQVGTDGASLILYVKDKSTPNAEFKRLEFFGQKATANPVTDWEAQIPLITEGAIKQALAQKK